MTRIAIVERGQMNADQGRVYDAAKSAGGPVGGPYYAYIRIPKLFEAAQHMRGCLGDGPLSGRERQLINLVVARHWGAKYPWSAQVRASLKAGVTQAEVDAVNKRQDPKLADARENACYTVARELLANKGLSEATYKSAEKTLGTDDLVAAVAGTGSFSTTCLTTIAFDVSPPAENPTPLAE
jgi:4-carboxymuconolactone decarboxylase